MTERKVEDLGGLHEVARILDLSDTRVGQLIRQGKFPQPVHRVAATPLWYLEDIREWNRTRVKGKAGRPRKAQA